MDLKDSTSRGMSSPSDYNFRVSWLFFLLAATTLAIYLRADQILSQWLTDDEWHAIHKLQASEGYTPIFRSFGAADYSIPLTVLYRFIAEHFGLSELRMRLPMLVCGVALIPLAMSWTRRHFGIAVAVCFGFLLATSPLLINFSRMARPYSITLFLSVIALITLVRWLRSPRLRPPLLSFSCLIGSVYLHPINGALLAPPVIAANALILFSPKFEPFLKWRFFLASVITAIFLLALILPPLLIDQGAMQVKLGSSLPGIDTVMGAQHLWFGSGSSILVAVMLLISAYGFTEVIEKTRAETLFFLLALAGVFVALLLLQPAWVHNPLTFARYSLPASLLLLLCLSAGVVKLALQVGRGVGGLAALLLLLLFQSANPLLGMRFESNNLSLHSYFQMDYRPWMNPVVRELNSALPISDFWLSLPGKDDVALTIALAGSSTFESYANAAVLHQRFHGQRLVNLQTSQVCGGERSGEGYPSENIFLRNAVTLTEKPGMERQGVDLVVFDTYLARRGVGEVNRLYADSDQYERYVAECLSYLKNHFSPPIFDDGLLQVFAVSGARIS